MSPSQRHRATRLLVVLGILLSYISYPIYKLGGPLELYPFTPWRLYSAPVGANEATIHRLYVRRDDGASWQRVSATESPLYTSKEFTWQLEALAKRASESENGLQERELLATFARHVAPGAIAARIVAETVYPRARLSGALQHDSTLVYDLAW